MALYRVVWEIDVEAATAKDAAEQACSIQRRSDSTAVVFSVSRRGVPTEPVVIDLQQCE